MDPIDGQEALRGPSGVTVPIIERYINLQASLFPQLQLWHIRRLFSAHTVVDLHSQVLYVLRFTSHCDAAEIGIWMTLTRIM